MTAPVIAVDELGEAVTWPMALGHLLNTGTTGAGKSSTPRAIIGAVAHLDHVQPVGVDAKAVELAHLEPRLASLAVERDEIARTLGQVTQLIGHRRRIAARHGWRTWPATPDHPIVPVIVDELAEAATAEGLGQMAERLAEQAAGHLDRIGRLGRALGVPLFAATQRAEAKIIGGALRSMFAHRLALASLDRASYAMGLGVSDGAHLDHFAVDLSVALPGVGIWLQPGRQLRRVRVVWWDDDRLAAHLHRHAHRTVPLDDIVARAAHEARTL